MKNVIKHAKKGFLMVTMFTTLLSFANEYSFFKIKNDAKTTSLTLENVKKGNLLSIKDYNGIVLYKEQIEKNGNYTKGFDLTSLPNGFYLFELDRDLEIKTMPFKVSNNEIVFNKNLEHTTFKPSVRIKNDLVYISKLALNKEPLKIEVYFEDLSSTLVHAETIKDRKKVERIFKLTGLSKGTYKIICTSEGREFIKYITK